MEKNAPINRIKKTISTSFGAEYGLAMTSFLFIAFDIVHFVVFDDVNEYLCSVIEDPSKQSIVIVLGLWVLYIISLFSIQTIRKPKAELSKRQKKKRLFWINTMFTAPLLLFGIQLVAIIAVVSGWSEKNTELSEDWQQYPMLIGSLIYPVMIYFVVKSNSSSKTISNAPSNTSALYYLYLIPTIVIAELMINFSFAIWYTQYIPTEVATPGSEFYIEDPSYFLSFVIIVPIFFYFIAAPRFTFLMFNFSLANMLSGLVLISQELWEHILEHPLF